MDKKLSREGMEKVRKELNSMLFPKLSEQQIKEVKEKFLANIDSSKSKITTPIIRSNWDRIKYFPLFRFIGKCWKKMRGYCG